MAGERAGVLLVGLVLVFGLMQAPASARRHPSPTPSSSPTPTPPPEIPSVRKLAISEMVSWQAGILERSRYTDAFNADATDDKVQTVSRQMSHIGPFIDATFVGLATVPTAPPGVISYLYQMHCSKSSVYERLSLDSAGKIAGIVFVDRLDLLNPSPSPSPSP